MVKYTKNIGIGKKLMCITPNNQLSDAYIYASNLTDNIGGSICY